MRSLTLSIEMPIEMITPHPSSVVRGPLKEDLTTPMSEKRPSSDENTTLYSIHKEMMLCLITQKRKERACPRNSNCQ